MIPMNKAWPLGAMAVVAAGCATTGAVLTFDESGRLWGLSESGTLKYIGWSTRFPYIFRIDLGKLK